MNAVIISDTHMPRMAKNLPPRLLEELSQTDLIIHAGDWQTAALYSELSKYAPLVGVYGNADGEEIKQLVGEKVLLELGGFRVGVIHGHGKGKTTEGRAVEAFADENLDLLIYGHSHIPVNRSQEGLIIFNPKRSEQPRGDH